MYNHHKVERNFKHTPPTWCSQICTNAMNEVCLMGCAPKRDASGFELKEEVEFITLPRFSLHEWNCMGGKERQCLVGVRLKLLEDYIRGPVRPVIPMNGYGRSFRDLVLYQSEEEE